MENMVWCVFFKSIPSLSLKAVSFAASVSSLQTRPWGPGTQRDDG